MSLSARAARLAFQNNATPTAFSPITTPEIFAANDAQLATSMIGNTDSTTNRIVTASPDTEERRSQRGGRTGERRMPMIGIANKTRYVSP